MIALAPVRTLGTQAPPAAAPPLDRADTPLHEEAPALPVAAPAARSLVRHALMHHVFADYGCAHCSRSYERAMVRYQR